MKYITPFNFIVLAIILTSAYAALVAYETWSIRSSIKSSAAGHIIAPAAEAADLEVVMFYDYSCPFCVQLDPTIRDAAEKDGKVKLVYKFLGVINKRSETLARLAYAAGQQDAFLEVHDYFIAAPGNPFMPQDIRKMAEDLELDYKKLLQDSEGPEADRILQDNLTLAGQLGVKATPSYIMGNIFYVPERQMPTASTFAQQFAKARQTP